MANQTGSAKAKDPSPSLKIDHKNSRAFERLHERVARRAYQIYEQHGNRDGEHLEHWLQAETELSAKPSEIRESSSWYTLNVSLRGFTRDDISVGVESGRAVIVAEKGQSADATNSAVGKPISESIFVVARWPSDVDPSTASAYVKDGTLTLTVKRVTGASK